jgi:hypothetical protein
MLRGNPAYPKDSLILEYLGETGLHEITCQQQTWIKNSTGGEHIWPNLHDRAGSQRLFSSLNETFQESLANFGPSYAQ